MVDWGFGRCDICLYAGCTASPNARADSGWPHNALLVTKSDSCKHRGRSLGRLRCNRGANAIIHISLHAIVQRVQKLYDGHFYRVLS